MCDPDGRRLLILADDETHADVADAIDRPRKLSHVVLNTAAPAVVEEFYVGALGFRLVDRTRRMSFLNCNTDHHSIAVVPSERNTLNHMAFEMPSFDAVMRGIGRLRDGGFDIGWGVGRHGPGNNIFAYFAGIERLPLEYTAEVQQIDDTYRMGSPEDWKPVPGRMDQWGATSAPSPAWSRPSTLSNFRLNCCKRPPEMRAPARRPPDPHLDPAISRLFDLNGEANRVRKKQSSPIIAVEVRRFGHVINKDGVFDTHRSAERPTSIEAMIEAMDEAGIDKAAIVHSSTCYGYDCSLRRMKTLP